MEEVEVWLFCGGRILVLMFRVIQTGILMPLLLKVQGLNGGLPGSMEILRSVEGRSHGSY